MSVNVFNSDLFNTSLTTIAKNEEIYFKAKDVAESLGYQNTRKAIQDHVWDEFIIEYKDLINFSGGNESLPLQPHKKFILEPGFYQLVLSSNLPSAKKFQKWVTGEVLPTLRKTGQYQIKTPSEMLKSLPYLNLEEKEYWKYKTGLKNQQNDLKIEYHVRRGHYGGSKTQESVRNMKKRKYRTKRRK